MLARKSERLIKAAAGRPVGAVMRIAMVTLYLPSETKMGVGYQAHAMANAFIARGHSVTVFSACAKPADARYNYQAVDVGTSLRTFRFAWNLRKTDFSAFDVIHAHGDNYWLWSRRRRPPVIRTMHGSCLVEARNVPGLKEKARMLLLYAAELLAVAVADKTVCVSTDTLKYYPGLKTVIPNGVNLAAFSGGLAASTNNDQRPTNNGLATEHTEITEITTNDPQIDTDSHRLTTTDLPSRCVGINSEHEGTKDQTAKELEEGSGALQSSPNSQLLTPNSSQKESCPTILFVGTYQNRKRGKLLQKLFTSRILPALPSAQLWMVCSDAPAAAGVTVFGRIPEAQLTDLYRRAWVFCLPSTYEGFGIPYIEAMAAGTAVVASPNVGALEVTRQGQDGLVPKDGQLAETLLTVLTNPQERQRLEAAGAKRVKDFDFNTVCERYEAVYTALAAR